MNHSDMKWLDEETANLRIRSQNLGRPFAEPALVLNGVTIVAERPKEVLYLSGPMTGTPDHNFPAFNLAAQELRELGYEVVNPVEINPDHNMSWHECLRADIKALCDCDVLVLLPGWEGSSGAHLEMHIAHRIGMRIITLQDLAGQGTPPRVQ